jgi:O-acetyl-ADP-ribose deacetylase (regulator of RNase III)
MQINNTIVEVVKGGVDKQDVDAIVNAANTGLTDGAGITEIIFRDAGRRELTEEVRRRYPNGTPTGSAVITKGHKLKQPYIIHTPGPDCRLKLGNEAAMLTSSYRSCLEVADANKLTSIAFCSISTGIYGYPLEKAAPLAVKTVKEYLEAHPQTSLRRVVFAMWGPEEFQEFTQALETI